MAVISYYHSLIVLKVAEACIVKPNDVWLKEICKFGENGILGGLIEMSESAIRSTGGDSALYKASTDVRENPNSKKQITNNDQ